MIDGFDAILGIKAKILLPRKHEYLIVRLL